MEVKTRIPPVFSLMDNNIKTNKANKDITQILNISINNNLATQILLNLSKILKGLAQLSPKIQCMDLNRLD